MGHSCSALHMEGCPPGPLGHTGQGLARTLGMALTQPPSTLGSGWRRLRQETVLVVFIPEMLSQRGTPKPSAVPTPPLLTTAKAGCRSPGEMNPASVCPHLGSSWLASNTEMQLCPDIHSRLLLDRPLTERGSVLCLQPQEEPWQETRGRGRVGGTVASCSSGVASQVIHC